MAMPGAIIAAAGAAAICAALAFAFWERQSDPLATSPEQARRDLAVNRAYAAAHDHPDELAQAMAPITARTTVSIRGEDFLINGEPTYPGRVWQGARIEGLLLNARMVQGVFDDLNPHTAQQWAYPDTGQWDPERNTREFVAAMPDWRAAGLSAFTLNLQGGNAHGANENWVNSAFAADGSLHPAYFRRARSIIAEADRLGMVVILGLFYFRHDEALADEAAVVRAVDNAMGWLEAVGARNVVIEIDNECDIAAYDHDILRCARVGELIARVKARSAYRWLVSVSLQGRAIPPDDIIAASDFVLLHGNAVEDPREITRMAAQVRASPAWRSKPIVFNEDDHYAFDQPDNNFTAALRARAGWGYFDRRYDGENWADGYQSVPVDWRIDAPRKRAFFSLLREITGGAVATR